MPAKCKQPKPINILLRIEGEPAETLRELSAAESRSNSAQAKVILIESLAATKEARRP